MELAHTPAEPKTHRTSDFPDANPAGVPSKWSKRITGTVNPG
jgi:hypothetical protein